MSSFGPNHHGACMWAFVNAATVTTSHNASGSTDHQQGDTTVNIDVDLDSGNYASFINGTGPGSDQAGIGTVRSRAAGTVRGVMFDDVKNTNGRFDTGYHTFLALGTYP